MIDDRILFRGIEVSRLVDQAVEIGHAVASLHRDRRRRFPACREQPRDIGPLERKNQPAVGVVQLRDGRHVRSRVAVHEVAARRRHRDVMVRIARRQQLEVLSTHVNAIQMTEVRIAPFLASDGDVIEHARLLIDPEKLGHVSVAGRDRVLERARVQIVEIELTPVVAFGEPDDLVRFRQIPPVDAPVARLVERRRRLVEDVADRAGRRVGHAELLMLVIARGGHEREGRAIGAPLHVVPLAVAAGQVVTERRPVLVGRHLQADNGLGSNIDHDAVNHRHDLVARQRVFPRLQGRVPDLRVDEVHLANLALVLLERRDLLRIGRPAHNRPVALRPAGVIGRVAEVRHAIGGQRRFRTSRDIAHP